MTVDKIYTLTVIGTDRENHRRQRDRCWGWWPTLKEAQDAILGSPDFWLENGYYDYAVIEEMAPGFCYSRKEWWYSCKYIGVDGIPNYKIEVVDSPHPHVINWSMG